MQTLIYDIECYKNFFHVVTFNIDTKEYANYELDDHLLKSIILNANVNLIGWNNHSYDDLLLNFIAQESIPVTSGWASQTQKPITTQRLYELSSLIIGSKEVTPYLKDLKYADKAYSSIDIKAVLDPMPGLKKLEMRTGFHNVQDLPVAPDRNLSKPQMKALKAYCRNDVDATYQLYLDHAQTHIQLRRFLAQRFKLPVSRLESTSEPRAAEYILSTEATRATQKKPWQIRDSLDIPDTVQVADCIPDWIRFETQYLTHQLTDLKLLTLPVNPDTGYTIGKELKRVIQVGNKDYQVGIGGLHSVDEPGTWQTSNTHQLIDADVTSYYPSILLRDQLHPRGYDDRWSFAYDQIYQDRLVAKQSANQATEAHALKIILNSTFGKFGSQYSSFYDPTLLLRVTITGQLGLLMLIEQCVLAGIEVLSANTDGIMVNVQGNQNTQWEDICDYWQQQTRMNLEYTYYKRYARRDVNNYTALTTDNKVKNKGIFTVPDIKHDVQAPIIQKMARASLLYDIPPDEYLATHHDELSIHDFIFHFGATRAYEIRLRTGDTDQYLSKSNRWYVSSKPLDNQLIKIGGKLGNTINIPNAQNIALCNKLTHTQVPTDLNQDYYINKANELIGACI